MSADLKLVAVIDDDQAEWRVLSMANDKGKFAMQLGYEFESPINQAFERLMEGDMFRLIDITSITAGILPMPVMCRLFKLTPEGEKRRSVLRAKYAS